MWVKLLKWAFVAAQAAGLDKKVKGWVKGKLLKVEQKVVDKAQAKLEQVEDALKTVDPADGDNE